MQVAGKRISPATNSDVHEMWTGKRRGGGRCPASPDPPRRLPGYEGWLSCCILPERSQRACEGPEHRHLGGNRRRIAVHGQRKGGCLGGRWNLNEKLVAIYDVFIAGFVHRHAS